MEQTEHRPLGGAFGPASARQRILDASFELFARRGIRDVGVDELLERAGVAKATFYRHFRAKDDLVLACLQRWYEESSAAVEAAVARHRDEDAPALLAVFDVFEEWFGRGTVEVSSFLHVLMEMGPEHPLGRASLEYLTRTRGQLAALAREAGLKDPEGFAWSCHILLNGSIVAAAEGDTLAAGRARRMAALLAADSRPARGAPPEPRANATAADGSGHGPDRRKATWRRRP